MSSEIVAMVHHELKEHPEHFASLWDRSRTHEIRIDDRAAAYAVGQTVRISEYMPDSQRYTGRWVRGVIAHVTPSGPVAPRVSVPTPIVVFSFREYSRGADVDAAQRRGRGTAS